MTEPHLSDVLDVPPFVYLSGQMALSAGVIVPGGIVAQTKQCLLNIAEVLGTVGLALNDIVKATVWLRRADDFDGFNSAYVAVLGEHRPVRSTVVSELVIPDALIEIEVVAYHRTKVLQ